MSDPTELVRRGHADGGAYRRWIAEAGLTVESEEFVPEGQSGHQLFWALR